VKKWSVVDAFRALGAETNNKFAWSAQSPNREVTVLTLWQDEIVDDGTTVRADFINHPKLATWVNKRGNYARRRHLQSVWNGDHKFRVVMLQARDTAATPRKAISRWPDEQLTMTLLDFDPATGGFRAIGTRGPREQPAAGSGWSDAELEACVIAYRQLWLAQQSSQAINKSALRRSLLENVLRGRSATAYERRLQNISAVMDELGLSYVQGYLPLRNIGSVKPRLISLINRHWAREAQLEAPSANAQDLETRVASARQKLKIGTPPPPGSKTVVRLAASSSQFSRDPNVIAWVRVNAAGNCEACGDHAPFDRSDGEPYLEVHHVRPLFEGGPDTVDNAIAGCPNCHRRLHHAHDREAFRRSVIKRNIRLIDHPKLDTKAL
jgi:5-methylcytosine-specific restriction enzyme A